MPKSPSQAALDALLKASITPLTKAAGFRKSGLNYRRRRGRTVQLINVQSSSGSTSSEKLVYINIGVAFDAICEATGNPIDEKLRAGWDGRSISERMEALVDGECPSRWCIAWDADTGPIGDAMGLHLADVIAGLDGLDSLASFRAHPWFELLRSSQVVGRTLHLLGEHDAARAWVLETAKRRAAARGDDLEATIARVARVNGMATLFG